MAEERIAQVPDDSLTDVSHQVTRNIGAEPLEKVEAQDGGNRPPEVLAIGQHLFEDRLNLQQDAGRRPAVDDHRHQRAGQPPAVGARVLEETDELLHMPSSNPLGRAWCQRHASATIVSSSGRRGTQPRSARILCADAYRIAGSPARLGAERHATVRPVVRSTDAMTSLTDDGRSVPTL